MIRESLGVLLLCAYVGASLSRLEKEDILRVHNGLRGEVYPQAANMQRMVSLVIQTCTLQSKNVKLSIDIMQRYAR